MSGITVTDGIQTFVLKLGIDTGMSEGADARIEELSLNQDFNVSETYEKETWTFETTPMTSDEVNSFEDFLRNNSNIVTCSGIISGEYECMVDSANYIAFFKNGMLQVDGQILTISFRQVAGQKWRGGGH